MASGAEVSAETQYMEHLIMNWGKKAIVVTSRVHPAEAQASHSLEGMVDFLLTDDERAVALRKKYIFYIVPMLNLEGVMVGNQRANLAGFDLNRKWAEPSPWITPVIWATKNLAKIV